MQARGNAEGVPVSDSGYVSMLHAFFLTFQFAKTDASTGKAGQVWDGFNVLEPLTTCGS